MICPRSGSECSDIALCAPYKTCHPFITPRGFKTPPKPSLAEIERLADDHGAAVAMYDRYGAASDRKRMQERRAALMAAIWAYWEV